MIQMTAVTVGRARRTCATILTWALIAAPVQAGATVRAEIALDVGHTLLAPGATSARGRTEFEFNHELALALRAALNTLGFAVRLINEDGRVASLQARPQAAEGADLLLSLHHDSVNAFELQSWQWRGQTLDFNDDHAGHSLFVSRDNPDTAHSVLCARVIGARLQRMGFMPTHKNGRRRAYADPEHAVHYYDGLAVLRHARMAAVLFEADGIATAVAACLLYGQPADDERVADHLARKPVGAQQ